MANGRTVFPPLGQLIPGVLDTPEVKANCGLHSALKGMDKNALVISIVAYYKGKEICSLYDVGPLGKVSPLPSLGVDEPLEKVSPQSRQKPIEKKRDFLHTAGVD